MWKEGAEYEYQDEKTSESRPGLEIVDMTAARKT